MTPGPLAGVIPVIVTPFDDDDSIDYAGLKREIDFLCGAGCSWLSIGFGSEVARLSPAELDTLLRRVVEFAGGRAGVIGNAEVTGVQPGLAAVQRVAAAGGDLAMIRPGALEDIDPEAVVDMITAVADGSAIGLIVQDAPQTTFVTLPARTIARLVTDVAGVTAAKVEPPVSVPKILAVMAALDETGPGGAAPAEPGAHRTGSASAEAVILGGLGGRFYLEELAAGAVGTMPGPAYPELLAVAGARLRHGDLSGAYGLMARSLPFGNLASRNMDAFRYLQKHVLVRRGVLTSARLRSPHAPIPARLRQEIDEMVDGLDLLALLEECAAELAARKPG